MDADETLAMQLQAEEVEFGRGSASDENQAAFSDSILAGTEQVLKYESAAAQEAACNVMPLAAMRAAVSDAAQLARDMGDLSPPMDDRTALVIEMLAWFKTEFFSWVDSPSCNACGSNQVSSLGSASPAAEEAKYGAGRVEVYDCRQCGHRIRFPRFNDPVKLLSTRRGRCGEWSNCFCLCLRAAGFEARWVMDLADHVWCEYWSPADQRWVHVDSCEAAHDTPLLYEEGWGKQQTYVIAFGREGVADVTRRYTAHALRSYSRRIKVSESWLADTLRQQSAQLLARLPKQQAQLAAERATLEAKDTATLGRPQSAPSAALPGRTTGSKAWRESRGEAGIAEPASAATAWRRASVVVKDASGSLHSGAVRASGQNSPTESAVKAFDGRSGTKWLAFGSGRGAWLEAAVVAPVTSAGICSYELTAAQDAEERDPTSWKFEGLPWLPKADALSGAALRGTDRLPPAEWVLLDEQHDVKFGRRGATLKFQVTHTPLCSRYRLTIAALRDPAAANSVQLDTLLLRGDLRGDALPPAHTPASKTAPRVSHNSSSTHPSKAAFAQAVHEAFVGIIATGDYTGREAVAAAMALQMVTTR